MYKTEFTKQMEHEFGNFEDIKKHFRPNLNKNPTSQEMFIYIKNHFRYNTMKSWNRTRSFANNVKIHNLDFTKEQERNFYDITSQDFDANDLEIFYDNIKDTISMFTQYYNFEYTVGFNGTSDGYLVLYKSTKDLNNKLITFPGKNIGDNFEQYDSAESYFNDYTDEELKSYFELLYDFDLICDIVRHTVGMDLEQDIEEYEVPQPVIKKKRFIDSDNKKINYEISVNEGLNNSQSYLQHDSNKATIEEINFNFRMDKCLNVENIDSSRKDFANLLRDIFTHYRNVRAKKEKISFWDIGKEFFLKYKNN